MSTNNVTAFHLVVDAGGKKEALLTINRLEFQQTMFEAIQFNVEVTLTIKQYETSKEDFLIQLKEFIDAKEKDGI